MRGRPVPRIPGSASHLAPPDPTPASHGHVWDTRETGPEAGGGQRLPTGRHPGIRIRRARLALPALLRSPLNRPGLVLEIKFLSVSNHGNILPFRKCPLDPCLF